MAPWDRFTRSAGDHLSTNFGDAGKPLPAVSYGQDPYPPPLPAPQQSNPAIRISDEERELVSLARKGDERGFAGLVRLHQRRAYIVARSIVMTHEDAEDAVQEGFLRAYQAIDRFDPAQTFGAWLNRIVANAALDLARRRKVRNAEEISEAIPSPFRDPAEGGELRERLEAALKQLPDRARAVIVLHDIEGFTHAEIGEMLSIPGGTARSDLHHARQKLRVLLGNLRD
ncbi:MAG TPA: RNA polymerase sigma factor [Candidatus Limnocylindrales bacterium]|nr:RNA polymerase sigma factor [Candidatus Limnocylindrales bacterium]